MKLYTSALSHFARKIKILLDLYAIPYEIVDVGNVAEGEMEKFANNPLSRVPVLVDGETWMIDSDHIAQYLVRKYDPKDRFEVLTHDTAALNIRSILNGIMSEEVTVIIARRLSVPTEQYSFFDDAMDAMTNGLAWLEQNADLFDTENPKYKEFHLVSAWEHLSYYDLFPMNYERLKAIVSKISENPIIRKSSPSQKLQISFS
jgi:glutathione S-transferase